MSYQRLRKTLNFSALELGKLTVSFTQSGVAARLCNKWHHRISPVLSVSKFRQQRDALKWSHQTLFFNHKCGEGSEPSLRRTDFLSHQLTSIRDGQIQHIGAPHISLRTRLRTTRVCTFIERWADRSD
jgi:hypothetical protein